MNPPKLFELVSSHLYRSNMISSCNLNFIESLHLKTIVYVGNSAVEDAVLGFIRENGIRFVWAYPILLHSAPLTIRNNHRRETGNPFWTIR